MWYALRTKYGKSYILNASAMGRKGIIGNKKLFIGKITDNQKTLWEKVIFSEKQRQRCNQ
jgi:hypothetical protein